MTIAVDFDGTLALTKFPKILGPNNRVLDFCKRLKASGHTLILYTCRSGESLDAAVEWCKEQGLTFDYVNENVPEKVAIFGDSRKIYADIYLDDRNWELSRLQIAHDTFGIIET